MESLPLSTKLVPILQKTSEADKNSLENAAVIGIATSASGLVFILVESPRRNKKSLLKPVTERKLNMAKIDVILEDADGSCSGRKFFSTFDRADWWI